MRLSDLKPAPGARKKRKRIGCGPGSGHGKTATRGHKGAQSRSGSGRRPGFEGGQMPIHRRIPKRGFRNPFRKEYQIVNIGDLERCDPSVPITPEVLVARGLIRKARGPVKVLGDGKLQSARMVQAHAYSKKAREILESLGGKAEVIKPR